ncbi:group 3 secretory phospholipase A2-like isoform X2 [Labrus mixtus]|uniref:group 3 secretory phospholipase A2-like isoform X2 n=1 Tax=Labrus mixtus TaxID=508554 RepID=UPI0029C08DDA|nr:group 3 secretory phospholipase A2-like isoform X2 [Labrus mixtus]
MHSRCLPQVLLALSSLIFSKAQDFMGSGISCVRSSRADDGQTRVTFLREETAGARSLYLTLWSEDKRLVTCEVNPSPVVTERYLALCDECNTQRQEVSQRFNISALLVSDAPCAPRFSDNRKFFRRARQDGKEGKTRSRRSVIFPGTLWCGTGSRALGYEQLGMFEGADRCCREHDHCQHIIPAFTVNYGVFNSKFFTVSHCDCDQRFRQCLLGVNDTISSMVGYSFFNILQVPCFELKPHKRCTEMYWWGMCKVANVAPYAFFKSPVPFNTSDLTSQYGDNTDSTKITENHLLCESLKHLDECQYKIPPLEKKYELQNMESKTAYHCDCTSRLALEIKSYKQPSVLPTLLMDFVSEFCFKPPKERKCHSKKSCSGGFTKASDLLRALKKIEGKATAVVRNAVNDRKRGIPVRLSKRCLRLQREAAIMAQLTRL